MSKRLIACLALVLAGAAAGCELNAPPEVADTGKRVRVVNETKRDGRIVARKRPEPKRGEYVEQAISMEIPESEKYIK